MRIAPARSAKKSRPSGAHASAVVKCASGTKPPCPLGPSGMTGAVAHGSGGAVVVVVVGARVGGVVGAGRVVAARRVARPDEPPPHAARATAKARATPSA